MNEAGNKTETTISIQFFQDDINLFYFYLFTQLFLYF